MKTSTEIESASKLVGAEKAIEYIAKAGFDAWDFSMMQMCMYDGCTNSILENDHPLAGPNYLQYARRLKQVGLDNGIICNQSHAPFPICCPEIRSFCKRAIECTAEAGGEICVIHPDNDKSPEENAEVYFELLPFAKEHNVKIATENMWNWDADKGHSVFAACATPDSFNAHLDAVNDDYFVACLDIGHAEMKGSDTNAVNMIQALDSRMAALHIHDNNQLRDLHQIPFSMQVDFEAIVRALKSVNYQGYFTLECVNFLTGYTSETCFAGVRKLADAARKLADMYEAITS